MEIKDITESIRAYAISLGFLECGFSKSRNLEEHASYLDHWLKNQMHGEMRYMENNREKRLDPTILEEGTQTVISVLLNYYPTVDLEEKEKWVFSKYAYGKDYHYFIKDKLALLLDFINKFIPNTEGRIFVDSAPVLDRAWAVESGLGWIGKNGNLISPKHGSFFFIGEILLNQKLHYDQPETKNYCGNCTKCIDACPTQAIYAPKCVDARKCLSYATIEYRGNEKPEEINGKMNNRIYGCDICQDVCPWNKKHATATKEEYFTPIIKEECFTEKFWDKLSNGAFKKYFNSSPIQRAGLKQIRRNISWLKQEPKKE